LRAVESTGARHLSGKQHGAFVSANVTSMDGNKRGKESSLTLLLASESGYI